MGHPDERLSTPPCSEKEETYIKHNRSGHNRSGHMFTEAFCFRIPVMAKSANLAHPMTSNHMQLLDEKQSKQIDIALHELKHCANCSRLSSSFLEMSMTRPCLVDVGRSRTIVT
jgi:hypothetical protein